MKINRKWLWMLPILWFIALSVAHPLLNTYYLDQAKHSVGEEFFADRNGDIWEARRGEAKLLRHTGSWSWRFFHWGLRHGGIGGQTSFGSLLRGLFNMSSDESSAFDITNPTPAMVLAIVLVIALVGNRGATKLLVEPKPSDAS